MAGDFNGDSNLDLGIINSSSKEFSVAALGWQGYIDGDATMQILFGTRNTWQAWKVQGYNLFSTFASCGK